MKIGIKTRHLFAHAPRILILMAFLCGATPITFAEIRHPAEQASIKSVDGSVGTTLAFINRSPETVKVYWLDYEGHRVLYQALKSQQGYSVDTYLTHPWLITNESDKVWYVYYADAQPRTIEIISPSEQLGPNLLQNGSFEKGTEGWEFNAWKDSVAKATQDSEVSHQGKPSVRIDQPTPTDGALSQAVTLKPYTRYRLEGWIKTRSIEKADLPEQRVGPEGASLTIMGGYQKTPSVFDTNDWTHVQMDFVTDERTQYKVGCRLGHYGKKVTGAAWYADISLAELIPRNVAPLR